ncbi:MAG: phosphate acetyltransferase [FCB group bacterium]|nr:phosphate acetyltransferase [FCB group bacterium]
MDILSVIKEKAAKLGRTVVLPEGTEERVIIAARSLVEQKIAKVILLGDEKEIADLAGRHGLDTGTVEIINPATSAHFENFVDLLLERRKAKGMTRQQAAGLMSSTLYFGAALVKTGLADASVAGSVNTTGKVLRAALHVIGLAPGISTLSSSFMMTLPEFMGEKNKVLLYADCAVMPNPDSQQLASIAASTADTMKKLVGEEPRLAFLSFSTKGSASHPDVNKVTQALKIFKETHADIAADGELQLDAALIGKIGEKKAPGSPVAGKANVLIFPDLDAGNIGYKLTQRLAGAIATGPIIQGLAAPANDLSRGCSADDIVDVSAIAVLMKG